jgi:hypothetical protein
MWWVKITVRHMDMNDKDFKEVNLEKKSKSIILPKNNVNVK